jgi:hypothetical protein
MSMSGTFNYAPGTGEVGLYAFNLCGIRSTALLAEHMESLRMAANMLQSRWSAQGVNLWAVDLQTVPLVTGQSTYSVPSDTIVMLDAYIVTNPGSGQLNRIILPVSRTEYASYPQPQQTGAVTVFWFDRLLSPTVTLYYVPDASQSELSYYRVRQIQDAGLTSGQQPEIPYYFYEAYALGLAYRLAAIWAPDRAQGLKALADEAYQIAASQNIEVANQYVSPMISSYFRA